MENTAMSLVVDDGSTCSRLLSEVSDWQDHPAWFTFRGRYDPLMRRWCRGYGLDEDSIDEVCQRIWIELADRMKSFLYDPKRTFRGWLRRLCESRVLDFLRQRRAVSLLSLDESDDEQALGGGGAAIDPGARDHNEEATDLLRQYMLGEAEKVQARVRAKVNSSTWDAFWLVAVCDWTVERTARSLAMTHTAVYAARARVARKLLDEGKSVSERWSAGS
jgi:RNA polymerase sigma factor (sigma-70 family)